MLSCRVPSDWLSDISACWYDWQTILGALLALFGAWLTVRKIREQIEQTEKQEKRRTERQHRAARTVLPLALSEIDGLCRRAASQIGHEIVIRENFGAAFSDNVGKHTRSSRLRPIDLPQNVISEMKHFVETLEGEDRARHVAELISSIQIMISRFNEFDLDQGDKLSVLGLSDLLFDVAKVRFLNDAMFNYGRFADDNFAVVGRISDFDAWDGIHKRLESFIFIRKLPEHFFNPINEKIQRYKNEGKSPWIEKFDD